MSWRGTWRGKWNGDWYGALQSEEEPVPVVPGIPEVGGSADRVKTRKKVVHLQYYGDKTDERERREKNTELAVHEELVDFIEESVDSEVFYLLAVLVCLEE